VCALHLSGLSWEREDKRVTLCFAGFTSEDWWAQRGWMGLTGSPAQDIATSPAAISNGFTKTLGFFSKHENTSMSSFKPG
jgi:hypothetical protein